MDYDDYLCMDHSKYDLHKTTKHIRKKKFICEAPTSSGKSTTIRKWISAHKKDRFITIVPLMSIDEEFYAKLCKTNKDIKIGLCNNDNACKEFHKSIKDEVNT